MFIASIDIKNFRCFRAAAVEFRPGVNVIVGENNAGKTALLKALRLVFERSGRSRLDLHDFCQAIDDYSRPPAISVTATLRSSDGDTLDDKALVATWLTKIASPWEAQLTYRFFLPEQHAEELAALKARLEFRAADITVRRFESDEACIQELAGEYEEYLESPESFSPEEREALAEGLEAWRRKGYFALVWYEEYWLSRDGRVVAT